MPTNKLRRRGHTTIRAARAELIERGYVLAHSTRVNKWVKKGKAPLAIAGEKRPRSTVFHIVGFPVDPESVNVRVFTDG